MCGIYQNDNAIIIRNKTDYSRLSGRFKSSATCGIHRRLRDESYEVIHHSKRNFNKIEVAFEKIAWARIRNIPKCHEIANHNLNPTNPAIKDI